MNNSKMHFLCDLKGLPTLDINIEALSIQLFNTSSFQTLIKLFINTLDGEEKKNLLVFKELPSRTLTRRVAWSRKVEKMKRQIPVEIDKKKDTMET
jgi:malonyl CoA-acyl carrier protein transacylase